MPVAQSDFWTRWQHTLLVHVHGAVLSQAALVWEMSVPSTAWPFSQVLLLTQELELEEDGLWRLAKLPCQCSTGDRIWILSQVHQGKIHFRLKKNIKVLKVDHLLLPWRVPASDVVAVMRCLSDSQAMKYGQGFLS